MTDELGIARHKLGLDELKIALLDFLGKLLAPDRLFERIHQMDRVRAEFRSIVVEGRGQNLERKPCRSTVHALIDASSILVFLHATGLRIGFLQALTVVN